LTEHFLLYKPRKKNGFVQTKQFIVAKAMIFVEFEYGFAQCWHTKILGVKLGVFGLFKPREAGYECARDS
jgi:hypothetical protein